MIPVKLNVKKLKNIHRIQFSCKKALQFCNYMYSDSKVFLDRKHDRFINYLEIKKAA